MGEIYAAYDDRLDRKVALKLVRGGSELTAKADERLLREAQTLAQVSHPNVVQIYEAGTYNGRLFIAMELIRGKTLTSWLGDAARLPRAVRQREILRQFIAAGHGLEAAHAAGVAHRDFKPDNVLVGDDGRVRVVDFGLARALEDGADAGPPTRDSEAVPSGDLAQGPTVMFGPGGTSDVPLETAAMTIGPEHALAAAGAPPAASQGDAASSAPRLKAALRLTETGTVMGTPSFMAPETLRGAIADRRSDQFSFCVALYHALYDAFPFTGRTLRELRDSIASDEVEFASTVSVPAYVRKALHRGLSVDPAQRFASMAELLAALAPGSRRVRGWIAVGASLVAIAASAAMALRSQALADPCAAAGAAIDAEWSAGRQAAIHAAVSRSALSFAESAWRGAKVRLDDYARSWRGEATEACRATHIAHTQSAEQLDRRMLCLERGRRQVAALASELGTGAPDAVEHAVEAAGALPDLDACHHAENLLFGIAPPPTTAVAEVAAVRDRLARARTLELLGRYDESLAIAREASAATERLGYPPVRAEALVQVARALDARRTADTRAESQKLFFEALNLAEAERHDQLAGEIWRRLVMMAVWMDSNMAQAHEWWGQAYAWSRRNAPAVPRSGEDAIGEDAIGQAELHYMLGEIYSREAQYAKAAEEERRAMAAISRSASHPLELSQYQDALAKALDRLDARDEAMQLHERAVATAAEALGATHPKVTLLQINYGRALVLNGRNREARPVLEAALERMAPRDRDSHPSAARIQGLLSRLELNEGRLDRAVEAARASLQIYERALASDHLLVAEACVNLANVELMRRNLSDALALFQRALELRRRHLGDDHASVGLTEGTVAEALLYLERYDDAMVHLVEAERILQRGSGHERGSRAWMLTVRGEILTGQRAFGAAVPVLENALQLFGDDATDPLNQALAQWTLARALHELRRDPSRVRSLAERAYAAFAGLGTTGAHDRDAVARFLAQLPRIATAEPEQPRTRAGSQRAIPRR
jgi:serine/threonine protein kinase/tetratricopeptide (TPR) repeat protein